MSSIVRRGSGGVVQGREEGPVRAACEVLGYRSIGQYHQLTLVAPEIATRAEPGQFVSVGIDLQDTVLRRPFSIAGVSQQGPWVGTLEFVFSVVGTGTAWLAERRKHDIVDVVGPLGRGFPMPREPVTCLLVGGGYGAAPLLYLGGQLQRRGCRVDFALGAASGDRIFNAIEVKRLATSATFVTEDGSLGVEGLVTDVVEGLLETTRAGVIYGCGPMGMLASLASIARERQIPCQVATEELMACGSGVCMTCVIPYRRRDGIANVRACMEGPVLDAKRVLWDAVRTPAMGNAGWEGGA